MKLGEVLKGSRSSEAARVIGGSPGSDDPAGAGLDNPDSHNGSGEEDVSFPSSKSAVAPPPVTVYRDTTPSGFVVEYSPGDGTKENPRWYKVNGVEVPSVTTVLDVLRKDGLSWWGMKVGVEGVLELFRREKIMQAVNWGSENAPGYIVLAGEPVMAEPDHLVKLLTSEKLTVNHALTKAGDRGTNVHSALEAWAQSGGEFFPTPQNFPEEERPYVEGLLQFFDEADMKPVAYEVMVGSAEYGFAGRFDLILEVYNETAFITRHYKRKEHKTVVVSPGRYRVDLKTSSGVYTSHHLQLAGYEVASLESGYEPVDGGLILRVDKGGFYELVPSVATGKDFLAVKTAYDALKRLS